MLFSFLGWCLEVVFGKITTKKFVNRGFLIGPLCPIYGTGCVLLYVLLNRYADDVIVLLLMSMFVCSVVEYIASYLMEKIFKARWWDYSKMKYNINGRICLEMAIPFALLGLLVIYIFFPVALNLLSHLSNTVIYVMASVLATLFLVDLLVSFKIIMQFTQTVLSVPKDMTEEITKFVKKTLSKHKLTNRLLNSFPNFQIDLSVIKKKLKKKRK